jgi:hypothetical protein
MEGSTAPLETAVSPWIGKGEKMSPEYHVKVCLLDKAVPFFRIDIPPFSVSTLPGLDQEGG